MTNASRIVALLSLVALFGCSEGVISIRFRSKEIQSVVQKIHAFAFSTDNANCSTLDPRGAGPGDAEERTGITAIKKATGSIEEVIAELNDLPASSHALVIEAYGPMCEIVGTGSEEPGCERLAQEGVEVMRGFYCSTFDLDKNRNLDLDADLETFALIGSQMEVPTNFPAEAVHYTAENPLPITDSLIGGDHFLVQLLNEKAEEVDDVEVRWTVESGFASFEREQPAVSAEGTALFDIQDNGLAGATLRAGVSASKVENGVIEVSAHAPGYEQSPIHFSAKAVPSVAVEMATIPIPLSDVDLNETRLVARPVLVEDLNGDGRMDIVTAAGWGPHRLIVLYAQPDGSYSHHVSAEVPRFVRALTSARLAPGTVSVIASTSLGSQMATVPGLGTGYVVTEPVLEVWSGLETIPPTKNLTVTPDLVWDSVLPEGTNPVTFTKAAIALTADDIDGDGVDEIALSRCSYVSLGSSWEYDITCLGGLNETIDSEIAVMRVAAASPPTFTTVAIIPSEGNDGGFRELQFADIDGDRSLDLVFASQSEINGICGRRNQPGTGFGFQNNPRFDTTITFGGGYSVGTGFFNDDDFRDVVVTGAVRAASPDAGLKLVPGMHCDYGIGQKAVIVGTGTAFRYLITRVADLNNDGWDDAILLHRSERNLRIYLGTGTDGLAPGPAIELPTGDLGELDIGIETINGQQTVVAATTDPFNNQVVVLRLRP